MTPHELIQKGIEYNDMDLVAKGYELLNSQDDNTVSGSIEVVENNPPIREIQKSDLKNPSPDVILEEASEVKRKNDFSFQIRNNDRSNNSREREDGGLYTRTEPIDTTKIGKFNMFEDNLTEEVKHTKAAMIKRAKQKDPNAEPATLYVQNRVPRKSNPSLVHVECIECNKFFDVAPIHARKSDGENRFVCDKCIKNRGRSSRQLNVPRM